MADRPVPLSRASRYWLRTCSVLFAVIALHADAALTEPLQAITAVQREGQGNEAASAAWKQLVQAGPAALPEILNAMGKGTPVADNWLRLAGDAIVQNALGAGQPLPLSDTEKFLKDAAHLAAGRRLAFDLLRQADSARADALEPSLLHDPVQELRRGAVQRLIDSAKGKNGDELKSIYLKALDAVRDEDQTRF